MIIPKYIREILNTLDNNGFEAYLVGGSVRDFLAEKEKNLSPKDWDITTNAIPKELLNLFPDSVYENNFGTVKVKIRDKNENVIDLIEITTYRTESKYSDARRPDRVKFSQKLEEDLKRRDFTINAIAIKLKNLKLKEIKTKNKKDYEIIDIFKGQEDLKNKIIRAVGKPEERFSEDALRMMRAIKFAVKLDFEIERKTFEAIKKNAILIKKIANERIRDEFIEILKSPKPAKGVVLLKKSGLLKYIIPELEEGIGVSQNKHHIYTVYEHLIKSLEKCPSNDYRVRLAVLFHDIGKPRTKKGEGENATFYNHDIVSTKMSKKIMKRLHFSNEDIKKVVNLIKHHMFYYNVGEVSEAGVRRLLRKVGPENIKDLIDLRISDRLGSNVPKAKPYKLRHFEFLIEKVKKDPISVKMLKINGNTLMKELKLNPGPKFGAILDCLLAEVIENPKKNTKKYLKKRAQELYKLELKELRKQAIQKINEKQKKEERKIKKKHWVK